MRCRALGPPPAAAGGMESNTAEALVNATVRRIQLLVLPLNLILGVWLGSRWISQGLPDARFLWWALGLLIAGVSLTLGGTILGRSFRARTPTGVEVGARRLRLAWAAGPWPTPAPPRFLLIGSRPSMDPR